MDGVKRWNTTIKVPFYVPVQDIIDSEQLPGHMSCDWLKDPLAFGIMVFPLWIYRKMEEEQCKAKAS